MSEDPVERFEQRSRELFDASVDRLDMRVRSRLNQARQAALAPGSTGLSLRPRLWGPALGAAAALVLGVAIWSGRSSLDVLPATSDSHSGYEDLELVASNDQLELLQDDIEFYDWVETSVPTSAGSANVG